MCACGCLLLAGLTAALVFCIMHGLWVVAAGVVAVACLTGWLLRKSFPGSAS
jgi:hypothetical protein